MIMRKVIQNRLREFRTASEYTQQDVAVYLSITRQGYAHYESGRRDPDLETLIKLSELYQVSILDFITPSSNELSPPILREDMNYGEAEDGLEKIVFLTPDEKMLLRFYKDLTPSEKKEILSLLKIKVKGKGE